MSEVPLCRTRCISFLQQCDQTHLARMSENVLGQPSTMNLGPRTSTQNCDSKTGAHGTTHFRVYSGLGSIFRPQIRSKCRVRPQLLHSTWKARMRLDSRPPKSFSRVPSLKNLELAIVGCLYTEQSLTSATKKGTILRNILNKKLADFWLGFSRQHGIFCSTPP